ncbi:Fe(III)-pyochelin receptor [Stutzerimonas stutzeri]|nr:Fe(III)-pyochelin receptor [Stutzerimonas stutzeri]
MHNQPTNKRHLFTLSALFLALHSTAFANEQLDVINVSTASNVTATENTKSYTTSAMKTTTGLELSPKETPQSVSVITKERLDRQRITTMEDALKTITGINVIPDATRWRYQSRGFYIDQMEEDGISTTVAGASGNPYNDPQSMSSLAIYDHIEVVRGATGLTQSNSEPGGTINAVRKKPTETTQLSGSVSFDRFGKTIGIADVSGSLNPSKTIRGRLIAQGSRDKTFKDNVDGDTKLIYGVIEADLGDSSRLTLGGMFQKVKSTPDFYGVPMGNGFDLNLSRKTYLGAPWNETVFYKRNVFAEFEHFFNDNWKWESKVNYIRSSSRQEFALAANTGGRFVGIGQNGIFTGATDNIQLYDNHGSQISWQNRLNGKFDLLGQTHDIFFMNSYSKEKQDSYNPWKARSANAYNIYTYNWNSVPRPDWSTGNANYTDTAKDIVNNAFSMGVRFNPTEKLHLITAGRYTRWTYRFDNNKTGVSTQYSKNSFVPYFGITYDLNDKHSLYASYTTIKKPQTNRDMDNNLLDPIEGTNYEFGWKSDWFADGKLNSSLAFFQIIQKNRPYDLNARNSAGNWAYTSIGKIRSRGFEAEISGALTENWQMFAGYTFNMSEYQETEGSRFTAGTNFSKHTPRHIFRLYTSYTLPFDDRKWSIGTGTTIQSKTDSLWGVKQGGYSLIDADIRYQANKHFSVSLIGTNLTDKRYYENARVRTMGINNFYGRPLNVMLVADWRF